MGNSSAIVDKGLINRLSTYDVKVTADRLEETLKEKGMNVFARINHAAGARTIDEELRPTELIIFGNPALGAPLMQSSQSAAIDLPMKFLVWLDDSGKVWITYNDPKYLVERHGIEGCDELISKIEDGLSGVAEASAGP